jgi:hypothetical protein
LADKITAFDKCISDSAVSGSSVTAAEAGQCKLDKADAQKLETAAKKAYTDAETALKTARTEETTAKNDVTAKKKAKDDSERKVEEAAAAVLESDLNSATAKVQEAVGDLNTFKEAINPNWSDADVKKLSGNNKTLYEKYTKAVTDANATKTSVDLRVQQANSGKVAKENAVKAAAEKKARAEKEVARGEAEEKLTVAQNDFKQRKADATKEMERLRTKY